MITLADWKATRYQKKLVKQVLKSGRLTYGPMTKQFEEEMAAIQGFKNALFTSSGTDALKIALGALKACYGWQDGDEVIIPAVTFIATWNIVLMNNLKPVLVDVEFKTANMDPTLIEAAITPKTRAIIPVHLFGQHCDMTKIMKVARKHKLKVIEDSCETMFVPTGPRGDIACYSTYVSHLLVTGVGGLIMTDNKSLATQMRSMMFHGRDESYLTIDDKPKDVSKRFYFPRFGYSDRATEMEAALGLGALKTWQKDIKRRILNAEFLMEKLPPFVTFPIQWHSAFMFLPIYSVDRDALVNFLEKKGIQTREMMPLITQPLVKESLSEKKYPIAEFINKHGFLIGCHQYLRPKHLLKIVKAFEEFYEDSNNR